MTPVPPGLVGPPVSAAPIGVQIGRFAKEVLTPQNLGVIAGGLQIGGILKQGKASEELANQRAGVDLANAEAVRRSSVERAKILAERGERLKARQKSQAISGGIKTNVGVPLLIEAQTRADITKDIGFDLETGRVESEQLRGSAEIEKDIGRFKKKKSRWDAVGVGVGLGLSYL